MGTFFLLSLTTLLTIVNPLGALVPFIAMTHSEDASKRRRTARRAAIVASGILVGCSALGAFIFRFYGITLPALKVAGGVLLFFVAFDMINARASRTKSTAVEESEGAAKEEIAVFPLAIPLLSGPGAIVSVFILADQASGWLQHLALYGAICIVGAASYWTLAYAHRITDRIGQIGMNIVSRLMGLVLATMAVQFVFDGLVAVFPALTTKAVGG